MKKDYEQSKQVEYDMCSILIQSFTNYKIYKLLNLILEHKITSRQIQYKNEISQINENKNIQLKQRQKIILFRHF